uniref:Terpene synthase N-terminal domain-containing protein n=1 Tax=Oryza glumipatula TaxID=40148 RepID=A0A0E0B1A0_9ORYZ
MQILICANAPPHLALLDRRRPDHHTRMHARRPRDKEQSKGIVYCKAKETQETVDRRSGGKDEPRDMEEMVNTIRVMLRTMGDGEISASAYDTAWVALVKNHNGSDSPQFPSTIDWISHNQLPDGSWGDDLYFLVHDRLLNTLACVIALMEWKVHGDKREKGLSFIRENIWRLAQEEEAWMPVGFEITFPSLLEIAKDLALDIPYDDPALHKIYSLRELKLKKIPREILHSVPTSLLVSIEGLRGLDWKRLLKLQLSDGSFLSSPAATAYVLMQTGDKKCLEFLDGIVSKFHGGDMHSIHTAPDMKKIIVALTFLGIDQMTRLGISYYFKTEIDEYCLEYTFRHWTKEGMTYNWHSSVKDIDIGSMAFRLLRLHGYSVSPSFLEKFEKDGEFVCYPGEANKSVSVTNNIYRAAQVRFPGDGNVMERAKRFCYEFLQERRAITKLNDKWVIADGLPGETSPGKQVCHVLKQECIWSNMVPAEMCGSKNATTIHDIANGVKDGGGDGTQDLPSRMQLRTETAVAAPEPSHADGIKDSGGGGACMFRALPSWIGSRIVTTAGAPVPSRVDGVEDSSSRASCYRWWYAENDLEVYGVTHKSALTAFFLAAANIFEPNRADERLGWARTAVLAEAISSLLNSLDAGSDDNMKERFISYLASDGRSHNKHAREDGLLSTLDQLIDSLAPDSTASDSLREAWKKWLLTWTSKERCHNALPEENTALLIVRTVEIVSTRYDSDDHTLNLEYSQLEQITSSICCRLAARVIAQKAEELDRQVDMEMQKLALLVLQNYNAADGLTNRTFLDVVKSFCYIAHCLPETVDRHIFMVMFAT